MLRVTVNVPLTGPLSFPFIPGAIVATAVSLSVMLTVAADVPMVTNPPITLLKLALKVSAGSTMLSSLTGTVNVKLVPAAELAGNINVPAVAV
ncbi:hypothetical protein D3C87_716110 [compost metagenome]